MWKFQDSQAATSATSRVSCLTARPAMGFSAVSGDQRITPSITTAMMMSVAIEPMVRARKVLDPLTVARSAVLVLKRDCAARRI